MSSLVHALSVYIIWLSCDVVKILKSNFELSTLKTFSRWSRLYNIPRCHCRSQVLVISTSRLTFSWYFSIIKRILDEELWNLPVENNGEKEVVELKLPFPSRKTLTTNYFSKCYQESNILNIFYECVPHRRVRLIVQFSKMSIPQSNTKLSKVANLSKIFVHD